MCLILTCRAIPWKEKLVFFFIWSGNIFAKWKKNSLDKEGMKMAKFICMLMAGVEIMDAKQLCVLHVIC